MVSHNPTMLCINEYIQIYFKRLKKAKELGKSFGMNRKIATSPSGIPFLVKSTM
jgi:hypothetical protein